METTSEVTAKGSVGKSIQRPIIFNYRHYRDYLADFVEYLRSIDNFSTRKFAEKAGFSSPGYLVSVIHGQRELTVESAKKVAHAFELNKFETNFLKCLLVHNRSKDEQEKLASSEDLKRSHYRANRKAMKIENFSLLDKWYYPVIYEALPSDWQKIELTQLAVKLSLNFNQVTEALEEFEKAGVVIKKGNVWRRVATELFSADHAPDKKVLEFHREMTIQSAELMESQTSEERELGALTLNISPKDLPILKKKLRDFRHELNEIFGGTESQESVYQILVQAFPILKK